MNWLLLLIGLILLGITMLDALWTTLAAEGGGPITSRLSRALWSMALRFHRRSSDGIHQVLAIAGTVILLAVMGTWIVLLWTGWTFVFLAESESVVHAQSSDPADLVGRIYFTGYTIFTLGIGNYVPNGRLWEIATAVASMNGLFLITLAITYLVPVFSAVVEMRRLAAAISDLGYTPVGMVKQTWDGRQFARIESYLSGLLDKIEMHAERHLAYPIIHYFHSSDRRTAVAPRLAALDEALLLLQCGVAADVRLPESSIRPVRSAIASLLSRLNQRYIRAAETEPPAPALRILWEAKIPTVGDSEFEAAVREIATHRRLLCAYAEDDGWTWNDVVEPLREGP